MRTVKRILVWVVTLAVMMILVPAIFNESGDFTPNVLALAFIFLMQRYGRRIIPSWYWKYL